MSDVTLSSKNYASYDFSHDERFFSFTGLLAVER